ncbi:Pyranose 2-oxidase [Ceratobasidium sp. 392]|nr:Pyranose 2-oxidase [Ceratobasidium sp. 392]
MSTLGEIAWSHPPGQPLIQSNHNPDQKPEENLKSYITRTVGGMATHWTCACPFPHEEERKLCPVPKDEFDFYLKKAYELLNVNLNEYDHSIRHNLVKDALASHYGQERVKNLPLAVKRNTDNPEYVTWTGVDTILGEQANNPRFKLLTETRVTKLDFGPVPGGKKALGVLVRDLNASHETRDCIIKAKYYVIACGAVCTPQILWNSGIQPDALGRYLTEQSLTFCQIVLRRSIVESARERFSEKTQKHCGKNPQDPLPIPFNDPEPQVTMPYSTKKPYHTQIHRDAFAYGDVGPRADPRVVVDLRFFGKQDINKDNRVTFAQPNSKDQHDGQTDAYGMPQATFHVTRSADDAKRDHDMMKDMCEAAHVLGAYLPKSEPQFMEPGLVLHITGTTRAGKDKATSVCDENSKIHDIDNVYVGGNNVIPDSTACNPTLTSVAYALKGAHDICERLNRGQYLLNPYTLLTTLARSTATIDTALTAFALLLACRKQTAPALLALAALTHLSLPSVLVVSPLIMVLGSARAPVSALANPEVGAENGKERQFGSGSKEKGRNDVEGAWWKAGIMALEWAVYVGLLAYAGNLVAGGWGWIWRSWGAVVTLSDATPNCGLWWYFFTEMFDHYRPFFLFAFSAHPLIYVAPICMKFKHDPFYAAYLLLGVSATLKSYPTLADAGLFVSLTPLFPETFAYLRHPLPTFLLHLHSALLMPLASHLWLAQGTGNANFLYAATLVYGLANGAMVIDAVWGGLRAAFVTKDGEEVVQL